MQITNQMNSHIHHNKHVHYHISLASINYQTLSKYLDSSIRHSSLQPDVMDNFDKYLIPVNEDKLLLIHASLDGYDVNDNCNSISH